MFRLLLAGRRARDKHQYRLRHLILLTLYRGTLVANGKVQRWLPNGNAATWRGRRRVGICGMLEGLGWKTGVEGAWRRAWTVPAVPASASPHRISDDVGMLNAFMRMVWLACCFFSFWCSLERAGGTDGLAPGLRTAFA